MQADTPVKTIDRAAALLRLLGEGSADGWQLSALARRTGLGKATTHRLLSALMAAGFAEQDEDTRHYHLGYEIVRLGATAPRYDIVELARPGLIRLAQATEDTVFLSIRHGAEAVCIDREVGTFPIKTLTLNVGDRRPLGVGAGSLALLAFLPEDEMEDVLARLAPALNEYPRLSLARVRRMAREARSRGYAFNDSRVVAGMSAIGVPVFDAAGHVKAALSVAAINERMRPQRVASLVTTLAAEAERLKAGLQKAKERTVQRGLPRDGANG